MNGKMRIKVSKQTLASLGLILYLCKVPIKGIVANLLHFPGSVNSWITIFIIYFPLLLMPFIPGKKRNAYDFLAIWFTLLIACMVTYLFHPEYKNWLFLGQFNVWEWIFRPDAAIFIYLFIRLVDDSEALLKSLKVAIIILFLFN